MPVLDHRGDPGIHDLEASMPDDMPMKSMAGRVSVPLRPSVTCVISSLLAMGGSARADVRAIADSGG